MEKNEAANESSQEADAELDEQVEESASIAIDLLLLDYATMAEAGLSEPSNAPMQTAAAEMAGTTQQQDQDQEDTEKENIAREAQTPQRSSDSSSSAGMQHQAKSSTATPLHLVSPFRPRTPRQQPGASPFSLWRPQAQAPAAAHDATPRTFATPPECSSVSRRNRRRNLAQPATLATATATAAATKGASTTESSIPSIAATRSSAVATATKEPAVAACHSRSVSRRCCGWRPKHSCLCTSFSCDCGSSSHSEDSP